MSDNRDNEYTKTSTGRWKVVTDKTAGILRGVISFGLGKMREMGRVFLKDQRDEKSQF